MKSLRLASLFLAALVIPVAAHAADIATVFSLNKGGKARVKKGESYNLLAVGNNLEDGNFVQVGADSTLGVKLVDGTTAYFGPNSAFRLKFIADSGPGTTQITLLSGTVVGDFSSSNAVINTIAGTIQLSGSKASVKVAGSNLHIVNAGPQDISVTFNGQSYVVPAGFGSGFNKEPLLLTTKKLSSGMLNMLDRAVEGKKDALVALTSVKVETTDSSTPNSKNKGKETDFTIFEAGHVFSPNGEGSTTL